MGLEENLKALVASHPLLIEGSPSPTVALEKIQHYDGTTKVPEAHAPKAYYAGVGPIN